MKFYQVALFLAVMFNLYFTSDAAEVAEILENLSPNDLNEFIQHFSRIKDEWSLQNIAEHDSSDQDMVQNFDTVLKQWVIQKYGVRRNTRSTYSNMVCFPNGNCINVDDSGIHP